MRYEPINEIAKKILIRKINAESESAMLYSHGLRVGKLSKNMASALGVAFRPEVLYIAALFHDCAVGLPEYIENAWLAREALKDAIDASLLGEVCELIELKETGFIDDVPELICVMRDADTLDKLGTKAIWTHFGYCHSADMTIEDSLAYYEQGDFERRMSKERKTLYFELSKDIFDQRVSFCLEFAQRMRLENDGNLV